MAEEMVIEKGKKLGFWNLVGFGIGGAIGTGIFVLLGFGIAYTGRSIVVVVSVGILYMLLAYWYQLVMSAMFVVRGGDYGMRAMLMNPTWTGISSWFTLGNCFATCSYFVATTGFLLQVLPGLTPYSRLVTFLVATATFIASIRGSRFMAFLQNATVVMLIVTIVLFVTYGVPRVNAGFFFSNRDGNFFHGGFGGFISAIAVMAWACQGTTAPITMAAVAKNPKRTVPYAVIVTCVIVAIVYAVMAYVGAGVLPYDQIAGQNVSVSARAIFPTGLYIFFVVGGGIGAVASSVLASVAGSRYPFLRIAQDGWLPIVFKKTTKGGYPYVTYLLYYIMVIIPIFSDLGVDVLVSLYMIPQMLTNAYMNFACITLPKKYPEQWERRALKMPLRFYNVSCLLGGFCALLVAVTLFRDLSPRNAVLAAIVLAVMFGLTFLRLKQGAVKKEYLDARRDEIVAEAIADTARDEED